MGSEVHHCLYGMQPAGITHFLIIVLGWGGARSCYITLLTLVQEHICNANYVNVAFLYLWGCSHPFKNFGVMMRYQHNMISSLTWKRTRLFPMTWMWCLIWELRSTIAPKANSQATLRRKFEKVNELGKFRMPASVFTSMCKVRPPTCPFSEEFGSRHLTFYT